MRLPRHNLSMKEVHMIAFLTMRGWALSEYSETWTKDGFRAKVNKLITAFESDHETEFFELEEAYKAETQAKYYLEVWR